MRETDKRRSKKPEAVVKRNLAQRFTRWMLVAVAIAAAVFALVVWRTRPGGPSGPSRAGKVTPALASLDSSLSDAEKERALRAEQLQVAEKLLTDFPGNDDAAYLAGMVHQEQGDSDKAMQFWIRSLELDATRADANESLGYALLLRDDYEGAERYFRKALVLDPTLLSARLRLATALSHQGKMREVISVLENTNALSAEAHRLLGEAHQQAHEYDKAKTHYEAAIRLKPDLSEAYYALSQVCAKLGDRDKGNEYLERFTLLKNHSDEEGRRWRANFSPLSVTRKSVAQTHTDVGRVYMTRGQTRTAEELWLRAATLDPSNALCRLQLAVHYQHTQRPRPALQCYEEVAQIDPADGLVHLNLGRVSLKLNQPERAEQAFKEVMKLAPQQPEGYSSLAELYLQANRNLTEARRLAETAVTLAPEAPYFAMLGQACVMTGDRASALAAFDRAVALQPDNAQYHRLRDTLLRTK